jgi:uncharacterized protein with FMN-binding domain
MAPGKADKNPRNAVLALSSAAVIAVYSAGYLRTRSAADSLALEATARRPSLSAPADVPAAQNESAPLSAALPEREPGPPSSPAAAPSSEHRQSKRPPRTPSSQIIEAAEPTEAAAVVDAPSPIGKEPAAEPIVVAEASAPPAAESERPAAAASPLPVAVPATAIPPVAPPEQRQYKDGTYFGWGRSRHGDIQASVVIEAGRIASATIAQCLTRYSCSVIAALPPQVAVRQSADVDYVSGATQSANAFYYAVVEALSQAR